MSYNFNCSNSKTAPVFDVPLCYSKFVFKLVRIEGGPVGLLISDPDDQFSTVSVCFATGSHNDPDSALGLAHLCEHMVFFGTKDFPVPNSFDDFLERHGGGFNAYTTGETTNFTFTIPSKGMCLIANSNYSEPVFEYALKNFASFFINPLFSEKFLKNEILSIQSEHDFNIKEKDKILFHCIKLLANKNHPFSRFSTGNVDTLRYNSRKERSILANKLRNHFRMGYTPSKMCLVIKGPQSLNHLFRLATNYFGNFKSKSNIDEEEEKINENISRRENSWRVKYKCEIFRQSRSENCLVAKGNFSPHLKLIFPFHLQDSNPEIQLFIKIWVQLLGDESSGTLCSTLVEKLGLADSVYSSSQCLTFEDEILELDIHLTEKGISNINIVIELTFRYINEINSIHIDTITKYLFKSSIVDKISFIHSERSENELEELSQISESLMSSYCSYKLNHFMRRYSYWEEIDEKLDSNFRNSSKNWRAMAAKFLQASRSSLTIYNMKAIILTKGNLSRIGDGQASETHHIDKFYKFEYQITSLFNFNFFERLECSAKIFSPPKLNLCLSKTEDEISSLRLKNECKTVVNVMCMPHESLTLSLAPRLIDVSHFHEIWYKQERNLNYKCKIGMSFSIEARNVPSSPKISVAMDLISYLVSPILKEKLYQYEPLGLIWGIFTNLDGRVNLTFNIRSLKYNFSFLLNEFVKTLKRGLYEVEDLSQGRLELVKNCVRKLYEAADNFSGINLALAASLAFLEPTNWSLCERLKALENMSLRDLSVALQVILSDSSYISTFMQGDLTENYSIQQFYTVESIKKFSPIEAAPLSPRNSLLYENLGTFRIKSGQSLVHEINASEGDPLNTVFHFIQLGIRDSEYDRTISKLISYIFRSKVTSILRDICGLGYNTYCGEKILRTSLGVYISVQNSKYSTRELHLKIEKSISILSNIINRLSDKEFKSILEAFCVSCDETTASNFEMIPGNALYMSRPLVQSSNFEGNGTVLYNYHKSYWEKIISRTYRFGGFFGNEEVDLNIISNLSQANFLREFNTFITMQTTASYLTIMINSKVIQTGFESGGTIDREVNYQKGRKRSLLKLVSNIGKNRYGKEDKYVSTYPATYTNYFENIEHFHVDDRSHFRSFCY